MHTPADPSPGQDLSLQHLWIRVQSNTAEMRLASSSFVWHVNISDTNLHQVLSTWLSQEASLVWTPLHGSVFADTSVDADLLDSPD